MAYHGATLQSTNNEVVKGLDELLRRREKLQGVISAEEEVRKKLRSEMSVLQEKLDAVEANLSVKVAQRDRFDTAILEAKNAYQAIVENSQMLLKAIKEAAGEPIAQ